MTANPIDPESEALYRILRGEIQGNESKQMSDDEEFAAAIRQTAQNIHVDPIFQTVLEMRLKRISPNASKSTQQWFSGFAKTLAWVAGAAVVVFIISWSIRTLLPIPLAAPTITMSASTSEASTSTPTIAAALEATAPVVEGTPEGDVYNSPLFPDNIIIMKVTFPASPGEAKVFTQNFEEALTIDTARAIAQQLGFDGNVYQAPSENPQITNYYVSDGVNRVLIYSPHYFYYEPNYQKSMESIKQDTPTTDEQISIAESFLKDHGLLDFSYRVETVDTIRGMVTFAQLIDGNPIIYGSLNYPAITVQVSPKGEIKAINYNVISLKEIDTYPIHTVEEAWQKVLASDYPKGVESGESSTSSEFNQVWLPNYPQGQRIELFGYLEILQPAEVNGSPLVFLNNFPLSGNLTELAQSANSSKFMQIWGQFQPNDKGNLFFQVEGWQPSPFVDQTLKGVIQRQGDQGYLVVDDKQWLIPGLPAEVPDGINVYVRCITLENEASLDWSTIGTALGGGGGGGGGGSGFFDLNLDRAPTPVPSPTETPYPLPQIGERFDGLQGNPYVTFFNNPDGSTKKSVYMNLSPTEKWPGGLSLNLTGDGLAGIEAYHQLPVKIWGSITDLNQGNPIVTVERYEPVYPNLKGQAWMGTLELVSSGGKPVLLFTDQSGSKYVLNTSLESEAKTPTADVPFIVEGVVYPDQTYEGYPVLHDFMMFEAQGIENLDNYEPQSISPNTMEESSIRNGEGTLTIERIELAYYTSDLRWGGNPDSSTPLVYAQPVWCFYGHYENGPEFEIIIQALSDEYLK
jgi:hypothetical protein